MKTKTSSSSPYSEKTSRIGPYGEETSRIGAVPASQQPEVVRIGHTGNMHVGDPVRGLEHLLSTFEFLSQMADLIVHEPRCLGWGWCSIEHPICEYAWTGVWTELTNEVVREYLDGSDPLRTWWADPA